MCFRFIASEKRGENLNIELWLLTEFHENGSLYDYLKAHVLTWSQICKIAETVASGLAFLHDEIPPTSTLVSAHFVCVVLFCADLHTTVSVYSGTPILDLK